MANATEEVKGRKWIYPKLIKGNLYRYRNFFSWFLLALLFLGPFIKINGEQLILLNLAERKFVFFGVIFWPQDFYLFVLAMIAFIVFIVLFTSIFGRVWCGWACPQTIFMEMVFRKIEYWIEGDAKKQKLLDASPWTAQKYFKKGLKQAIFFIISFIIANIFLAYIIGSEAVLKIISEPISQHVSGFISIMLFTLVFYGVFAYLREIVCTVICPYGRLQGVLLDNQSLIVAYDYQRGEPRGKRNRNEDGLSHKSTGDCIDCDLCVQVCPTGIDIREGTQLECINCTACIDACDMVMHKLNRPERLIGFKSEDQIAQGKAFKLNKRIYAYAAILTVLIGALTVLLIKRTDIETIVLRAGGTLYQSRPDGTVSNLYNVELVNKTNRNLNFQITPTDPDMKIQFIRQENIVKKESNIKLTFFVIYPQDKILKYKSEIELDVLSEGEVIDRVETTFIAPPNL